MADAERVEVLGKEEINSRHPSCASAVEVDFAAMKVVSGVGPCVRCPLRAISFREWTLYP